MDVISQMGQIILSRVESVFFSIRPSIPFWYWSSLSSDACAHLLHCRAAWALAEKTHFLLFAFFCGLLTPWLKCTLPQWTRALPLNAMLSKRERWRSRASRLEKEPRVMLKHEKQLPMQPASPGEKAPPLSMVWSSLFVSLSLCLMLSLPHNFSLWLRLTSIRRHPVKLLHLYQCKLCCAIY